jgi:hypothetical protein
MLAESDFIEVLQQIDNDVLGAVMILSTIGFFLTLLVTIVALFRTFNNVMLTRMNHTMVNSLLAKGYSVEEVERLTFGNQRWGYKLRNVVRSATGHFGRFKRNRYYASSVNPPVPPRKQTA